MPHTPPVCPLALGRSATERRAARSNRSSLLAVAVRGVQIWNLLRRVGFEGWVQTIARQLPWTRRVAKLWHWTTMPVRGTARAAGMPFRQAAAAAAHARHEAELAERAARLPWRVAYRKAWKVATYVDGKTGGLGSAVRGAAGSMLGLRSGSVA